MDIVYRRERATVREVHDDLPDPPSYSAVRALMGVLEEKGHLRHEQDGPRYIYLPTLDRKRASSTALAHLVDTFFDGSTTEAIASLLDLQSGGLTDDELDELSAMIEQARQEDR